MKIKELIISIFLIQVFAFGCSNKSEKSKTEESTPAVEQTSTQPETPITTNEDGLRTYGMIGNELFSAILDTIQLEDLFSNYINSIKLDFCTFY
jgi:PBP1b-binding outer membrane lipoprotein LpoB